MVDYATALPFNSPRWDELRTRRGLGAGWVRDLLAKASDGPVGGGTFPDMWPGICCEDTTYNAACAAAPYLVAIAERLPARESIGYLIVLGLIETYASDVPPDLEPGYRTAARDAQRLALIRLSIPRSTTPCATRSQPWPRFRGRRALAAVLQDLDTIEGTCASCASVVFPVELQQVVEADENLR